MNPAVTLIPAGERAETVDAWRERLDDGERLVTWFGRRLAGEDALLTWVTEVGGALRARRVVIDRERGLHTLTEAHPEVNVFERELHEQVGVRFRGHPRLEPVRFEGGRNVDDYRFLAMTGPQVHEVQVGPIHAGVIEPGAFRFLCNGETVFHLEIHLGYQHRGVEAALLRTDPFRAGPLVEVAAGDTSVGHAWAWAAAVEALAGQAPSAAVVAARTVMLELERAALHVASLAGLAQDIGALQAATTWQRIRTTLINTSMRLCGSRFGRTAVRPLATGAGWDAAARDRILADLAAVGADAERVADHFLTDPITRHRFVGCGVVTAEDARGLGLVGVAARACGLAIDLRGAPLVVETGDVQARAEVRARELQDSLLRVADALRATPHVARSVAGPAPLRPDALVVAAVEGARGEVVHALETDADGKLVQHKVQDPSLRNWMGLALALRGEGISDFPINNKSFDLSYCGNDL